MDVTLGRWIVGSARGDLAGGARASVGRPTWGPAALLSDLELRLGLVSLEQTAAARALAMQAQARAQLEREETAFFARSFSVDAAGTATVLLAMRDALVEGGWRGGAVAGAGDSGARAPAGGSAG